MSEKKAIIWLNPGSVFIDPKDNSKWRVVKYAGGDRTLCHAVDDLDDTGLFSCDREVEVCYEAVENER